MCEHLPRVYCRILGEGCLNITPLRKLKQAVFSNINRSWLTPSARQGGGLVQVIVDNFDANSSSQNGLQSTHGLAMLLTQPGENKQSARHAETIPRIKKEDMVKQVEDDVKVHIFVGPHKPDMPQEKAKKSVSSLRILTMQVLAERAARAKDFAFFAEVVG